MGKQARVKRGWNCSVATGEGFHAAGILVESQISGTGECEVT